MKLWDMLTDDAKDTLLIGGFLIELYLLFGCWHELHTDEHHEILP